MLENDKMRKIVHYICETLEMIAALMVLVGIMLSIIGIVRDVSRFSSLLSDPSGFRHYLEGIFTVVIGIEFLQMLCRPNSDNVIEILIFLVARHMIVGETNPMQDFVSVISIALLCVLRRWLRNNRSPQAEGPWKAIFGKQTPRKPDALDAEEE